MSAGPYDDLGMSDSAWNDEFKAQKVLYDAVQNFREAIAYSNIHSSVMKISLKAFEDYLCDEIPRESDWCELISVARQKR